MLLCLQPTIELFVLGNHLSQEAVGQLYLGSFLFQRRLVGLQLLQLLFEVEDGATHMLRGAVEQRLRETHVLGYLKGERAAGQTHPQLVERTHLRGVEQHGAVDNRLVLVGQLLEVGVMGGDDTQRATLAELFQQCRSDGTARARLGAATQLVEQEEGARRRHLEQVVHVAQM